MKFWHLLVVALLWSPGLAQAAELRFAVTAAFADDPFVKSFAASKVLAGAGLAIVEKPVASDAEAMAALKNGEADLGVFALDEADRKALQPTGAAASLLSRPYLFKSAKEVFLMQDSFLGASAAADAGRTGLFPLKIWSHSIEYLLTRAPVRTREDFDNLRMAAKGGAMDETKARQANAMQTHLDATTLSFAENFAGTLYLTVGKPETGLLAAAPASWMKRSEFEKNAITTAAEQARAMANAELVAREDAIRRLPNVEINRLDHDARMAMAMRAAGGEAAMKRDMAMWRKAEIEVHGMAAPPSKPPAEPAPKMKMNSPVFFATDRDDEGGADFVSRFGARRLDPYRMTCGLLGAPARHAPPPSLPSAPPNLAMGVDECAQEIVAATRAAEASKILILIHGFNTSFRGVAELALELGANLDYAGAIVAWSWPSEGSAFAYPYDEDSSAWSEPHLADLVTRIAAIAPDLRIDFVAHSMGNRILLQMLRDFALEKAKLPIGVAVFAAPDVSQDVFRQQLRQANKIGALRTLYASEYDRAILISQGYHSAPRAGSGGADILVAGGIESVDAQLSGHSYVFAEPKAMNDFKKIVNREMTAPQRGLPEREKSGEAYWLIEP
ncbi:alpha/beta hydrolase [Rhodoblastus acidophilus]|uniref:Alpha/beta hydrolase n=1 Tax=Candidatus Rhodoblastus alkanivorans TaxID=2954117 RepID=A0ABS9Z4U2_9HYPH|nr:alpha/beta hydrolase [Candidatus Rhodoblastus alkanivorans]MCI4677651.1 alpha/beta hydrolase [Candidatus Rhodoblastus alkanivorans]MCI4682617.1 alpha/beta hydrolase [Candidatus Rhodoblastus alkanivorans]MDI4639923.1 alpha/beta hydrolase [Rhodoblastus acidophilus]